MGNNNSNSNQTINNILSYEDAVSRLNREEFDHLKSSYNEQLALPNRDSFVGKAFLGFPVKFSDRLFNVISLSSLISFDTMLRTLVIMIRGSRTEKLQLLFFMLSNDSNKVTQEEMGGVLTSWDIEIPKHIDFLFTVSEECSFQHFVKWVDKFSPTLGVYDWVLDNDNDGFVCARENSVQTYHQFLAEQASFTEIQVMALEKHYQKLRKLFSRSKRFDLEAMHHCLHPLYTYEFAQRFFHAFDLNSDGNIDCRELVIGLSAILEGEDSFGKFVFSMFDVNHDGLLNVDDVNNFVQVLGSFYLVGDCLKLDTEHNLPEDNVSVNDFVYWCNNSCSMYKFLSHLKNIVYIVFGVKPDLTFNIIRQWMEMEANMSLITGNPYYIANSEWFKGSGDPVSNVPILSTEQQGVNGVKAVPSITSEGGTLRKGLIHGIHYQIISQVLWCTLEDWYGCDTAICRRARMMPGGLVKLELFPLKLNFYKQPVANTLSALEALHTGPVNMQASIDLRNTTMEYDTPHPVLRYKGVFYTDDTLTTLINVLSDKLKLGREDVRLWKMLPAHKLVLLDETEEKALDTLGIRSSDSILIEIRNTDMSWPEEVSNIINQNRVIDRRAPTARVNGTTGLNNLGNTCFMNSSIQCLSNTRVLSVYFLRELHLREVNQDNPDSLNGLLALRYGNLVKHLWSCASRTIAPLKMRWTIAKFAPQFNGFAQHDAQELLQFLLDGLHEDLNRITTKPYTQINDSGDRADADVAAEFWDNHTARNRSIIVDLFHGQLKSTLKCVMCGFTSVRFDPFSCLSLPLPENKNVIIEVFVVRLDPNNPTTQYCLWLNNQYTLNHVKKRLIAKLPAVTHFLFVEVESSTVNRIIGINEPLRNINFPLYVFELPGSGPTPEEYVIVYNRHYATIDKYFFSWQHRQVHLFGTPFVVATRRSEETSQSVSIKERIRNYVRKMYNFDEDFSEDLMSNINITKVKENGRDCCICPWKSLCYGHTLLDAPELGDCAYLTVDWSSAIVHLIRQYDDDVTLIQDSSVADAKQRQSQPVDLSACLNNFTKEEEISEWFCEKCSTHTTAIKKLDIWRLPPFLIIHLKRFTFQGGKWVKALRTVSFPDSFDPSPFLVQSSRISLSERMRTISLNHPTTVLVEGDEGEDNYDEVSIASIDDEEVVNSNNRNPYTTQNLSSHSYISSSMKTHNISKSKVNDTRPFYDLYALTSHTGQMNGGHYVAFAMNPNRQWYCYNDSQVKKTTKKRVLSEPAYMLFFERRNLKMEDLMPSYSDRCGDPQFDYDVSTIMQDVLHSADKERRPTCSLQ